MNADINLIYALIGSILILCILVYLMYNEGSEDSWVQISQNARKKIRNQ